MSGHFTDRDERAWQRRAEQRIAAPSAIGERIHAWITSLRRTAPPPGSAPVATVARPRSRPRPCEPA
ncbi:MULTISPECIES: hypothetical protein [unclassified Streptomyces]|uniref:hypothetical protein n=1 Tax=unclassified Streptomyces TaxID=2593676 RepID=UPI002E36A661|nr:hypothetical protein [Streptomyces sp. NBC_01268]